MGDFGTGGFFDGVKTLAEPDSSVGVIGREAEAPGFGSPLAVEWVGDDITDAMKSQFLFAVS